MQALNDFVEVLQHEAVDHLITPRKAERVASRLRPQVAIAYKMFAAAHKKVNAEKKIVESEIESGIAQQHLLKRARETTELKKKTLRSRYVGFFRFRVSVVAWDTQTIIGDCEESVPEGSFNIISEFRSSSLYLVVISVSQSKSLIWDT